MESQTDEDDQFFDSKEYSDTGVENPNPNSNSDSDSESRVIDNPIPNLGYEVWIRSPGRVNDRRQNLLKLMGLARNDSLDEVDQSETRDKIEEELKCDNNNTNNNNSNNAKIKEIRRLVSRLSFRELRSVRSHHSSTSGCSSDTTTHDLFDMTMDENLVPRIRNLDCGTEYNVDAYTKDWLFAQSSDFNSNSNSNNNKTVVRSKKAKKGLLTRLGIVARAEGLDPDLPSKANIAKVRTYRKETKDFSAIYKGQDLVGHEGAILAMKFSRDGRALASAGEDGVVRVWGVVESDRSGLVHVPDVGGSQVYFEVNRVGELEPARGNRLRKGRLKGLKKSGESGCVVFPWKVFALNETPLHEFRGHCGEVLDLSWSKNECLLSSSADKTVRLWKIGSNDCLQVFSHNNYVTRVQFNPVDENYFISGSVDGKVRSWSISGCKVVDWTEIKEIVTAVCYKPDGKGAVVGSITGDCYFYDTSENRLEMTDQTSLHNKKKASYCRRITGFQFSAGDRTKLIVTTADSHVQILEDVDLICKYKGLRNMGSQISPSFTPDGARIVSASEDSYIHIWDCGTTHGRPVSPNVRTKMSCERFFSNNASLAIPWNGEASSENTPSCLVAMSSVQHSGLTVMYSPENGLEQNPPVSSGFLDPFIRKAATWPQEKLMGSDNCLTVSSTTTKSEFMFLKTVCQNMAGSTHAWGSVIVTAGWDGRIRVFQNFGLPVQS